MRFPNNISLETYMFILIAKIIFLTRVVFTLFQLSEIRQTHDAPFNYFEKRKPFFPSFFLFSSLFHQFCMKKIAAFGII